MNIRDYLPPGVGVGEIHIFDTPVASTNIIAKDLAKSGAPHGTAVIASSQTGGKGRFDRKFFSPAGTGLYISFVLRYEALPELMTVFAGVCVCRAIENVCGIFPWIKWINDIIIDEKKICGILAEGTGDGCVVLGIGINIITPPGGFPDEIKDKARAIYDSETKAPPDIKNKLTAEVITQILASPQADFREMDNAKIIKAYEQRLLTIGQNITAYYGDTTLTGTAIGINEYGHLIVRKNDGQTVVISSGEISSYAPCP